MLLRNFWDERRYGAMIRAHFEQLNDMDLPNSFFFYLGKRRSVKKLIMDLELPDGQLTTNTQEILHTLSFYQELYATEPSDLGAGEDLLKDVPCLMEEDQLSLEQPLTLMELTNAASEQAAGKLPGLDGLTAKFYKTFWALIGRNLHAVFWKAWLRMF